VNKIGVTNSDQFFKDLETLFPALKEMLEKKKAALSAVKN